MADESDEVQTKYDRLVSRYLLGDLPLQDPHEVIIQLGAHEHAEYVDPSPREKMGSLDNDSPRRRIAVCVGPTNLASVRHYGTLQLIALAVKTLLAFPAFHDEVRGLLAGIEDLPQLFLAASRVRNWRIDPSAASRDYCMSAQLVGLPVDRGELFGQLLQRAATLQKSWGLDKWMFGHRVCLMAMESVFTHAKEISIADIGFTRPRKEIQFAFSLVYFDLNAEEVEELCVNQIIAEVQRQYKELKRYDWPVEPHGVVDPEILERDLLWYFHRTRGCSYRQIVQMFDQADSEGVKIAGRNGKEATRRRLNRYSKSDLALVKAGIKRARRLLDTTLGWTPSSNMEAEPTSDIPQPPLL